MASGEPTEPFEYFEITLHMKGGAKVVAAVTEFKSNRSRASAGGFTHLSWTNTGRDHLPTLHAIDLPELQAITLVNKTDPGGGDT